MYCISVCTRCVLLAICLFIKVGLRCSVIIGHWTTVTVTVTVRRQPRFCLQQHPSFCISKASGCSIVTSRYRVHIPPSLPTYLGTLTACYQLLLYYIDLMYNTRLILSPSRLWCHLGSNFHYGRTPSSTCTVHVMIFPLSVWPWSS